MTFKRAAAALAVVVLAIVIFIVRHCSPDCSVEYDPNRMNIFSDLSDWISNKAHIFASVSLLSYLLYTKKKKDIQATENDVIEILAYGGSLISAALLLGKAARMPVSDSDAIPLTIGSMVFGYASYKGVYKVLWRDEFNAQARRAAADEFDFNDDEEDDEEDDEGGIQMSGAPSSPPSGTPQPPTSPSKQSNKPLT